MSRLRLRPARDPRDCEKSIHGESTRPSDHQITNDSQHEDVKFETLTLLSAGPVHKEPKRAVNRQNRDGHIHSNSESCNACQESKDEPDATEELGCDRQEGQRSRNMHQVGEETHRPTESESSKPTQHLLCAMCEEDHAQSEPWNRGRKTVVRSVKPAKHIVPPGLSGPQR